MHAHTHATHTTTHARCTSNETFHTTLINNHVKCDLLMEMGSSVIVLQLQNIIYLKSWV